MREGKRNGNCYEGLGFRVQGVSQNYGYLRVCRVAVEIKMEGKWTIKWTLGLCSGLEGLCELLPIFALLRDH